MMIAVEHHHTVSFGSMLTRTLATVCSSIEEPRRNSLRGCAMPARRSKASMPINRSAGCNPSPFLVLFLAVNYGTLSDRPLFSLRPRGVTAQERIQVRWFLVKILPKRVGVRWFVGKKLRMPPRREIVFPFKPEIVNTPGV